MKIISVYRYDPAAEGRMPPTEETMQKMGALVQEMIAAGVFVDTGGTAPTDLAVRVRNDGKAMTVTDGPFTESKEIVGGFCVMNVQSKDEAIAWTKKFLDIAGPGVCEFHEVFSGP